MTHPIIARYEPKSKLLAYQASNVADVLHGFFTNEGGVSQGGFSSLNCALAKDDLPECVAENRARVASFLSVRTDNLLTAKQPHGADVVLVDRAWNIEDRSNVDAIVTRQAGIAVAVLAADCPQILFADLKNGVIAAAHAGWSGLQKGIVQNTIATMLKAGAEVGCIHAAIGPCIGYDSYEIGTDFFLKFTAKDDASITCFKPSLRRDRMLFDLAGYAEKLLHACSVRSVCIVPVDTYTDERFFSHRRNGHHPQPWPQIGNHIAAIVL